ncbi:MAG: bifunctional 3-(3-hydroxy-phenyl)propionate/3-hydroxycinnamic acid hydroxylase, partial [Acidimicrobiia bacterium]|nr:bifunctional 3-(3-hydroxy-phenyl)propionate/3-hydroxycinnamic acid hydroxylase [Acidimicrobiia bacterium]
MVDVAIVGGGPVGVSMSIALSTLGVTNVILERETAAYPLPRAIVMDAEIHRSMIRHGLGDELAACLSPMKAADFVDADGVRLMGIELAEIRLFGLPVVSRHYQPELEAVLRHAAQQRGAVLRLGVAVTSVAEQHDRVCIECDDGTTVEASWLVGCDGASSTVRKAIGISLEDLGFDQDWLVVDLLVPEKRDSGLPDVTRQVCDPRRPTTLVSGHGD